ncbi:MAG: aminopeptidase P N-terminal domain-containing protein [Myxococcota bacterium]|nr:aminopeptidase P N-terminal domain-containing protein [Myxococcota bacterium]
MPPDSSLAFSDVMTELAARRSALLERLGEGVAVLAAAPVHVRNNDVEHAYRQDSDFFYLTGLDEPESVAVITNRHAEHRFVLFVRPRDPERETWDGPRTGVDGAVATYGADAAFPISELAERLPQYLQNAPRLLFALGRDPAMDARVIAALTSLRRRQRAGVLAPTEIVDPTAHLHPMRLRKSALELGAMQRAVDATREAHLAAMRVARPGAHEHEVEAEILRAFRRHGCERAAYDSIVGSGVNATILHYRKNDRRMEEGELLLIDAGAEWGYQSADVTRTFPISGTFSKAQRAVYDVVLRAQVQAIDAVRPGATIEDVHQVTLRAITEGMIEIGLIAGPLDDALEKERYKAFYMHRTSHWLGMDVHDVGSYFVYDGDGASAQSKPAKTKARAMEPGMVLTVEPGIYVAKSAEAPSEYLGIGVRIEDDVLVTDAGHRDLTASISKDPGEIERFLASR